MDDTQSSQSHYPGAGANSKRAIPRLDRHDNDPSAASAEKRRASKACTNCRKRKVRCTGELPRCKNCEGTNAPCVYELARRDRLKTATEQNHVLVSLLRELSLHATEEDKRKIDATLEVVDDDGARPSSSGTIKAPGKRSRKESSLEDDGSPSAGEANVPASVGSNEDLDLLDEDLLRSRESRETGFVGQNSEVQWLRSLQRQMGSDEGESASYGPPGSSDEASAQRIQAMHERRKSGKAGSIQRVTDSSFYLDGDSVDVEVMLDPYELPPTEIAEKLFRCYIDTVHGWFPIIAESFEDEFYRYTNSIRRHQRYQVPDKWQAVLNLVFAIGAQFSHLTSASWRGDRRDHLLYMTRAVRILGVKDTSMFISTPELGLIQATGLLSFYYLVIGHVSRAWVMIGISLRFGLAVGLHLRNEDPSAAANRKETLARIWWSLQSVECLLSSITGRPCVLAMEDCTVPVPQIPPEERPKLAAISRRQSRNPHELAEGTGTSPSTSSATSDSRSEVPAIAGPFFDAHVKIGLITRNVLQGLYSARTAKQSWAQIQSLITSLLAEVEHWATATIPGGLDSPDMEMDASIDREKLLLVFHYYSVKILITRPCLCRLERRIKAQSDRSLDLNQKMAEECVQAASKLALLLPHQPDPLYIYQKGPWWCIVHNIMQAMAVFLLEIQYRGTHMTTKDNEDIPKCVKKLLRWLWMMGLNDAVAERAYKLTASILKSSKSRFQADITDLLADEEAGYDPGHLFQPYPGVTHPSDQVFAPSQWQPNFFDAANVFDPMPNPMSDPYSTQEQYSMPTGYENSYPTSFDPNNAFTMEEMWRNAVEQTPEYDSNVQQQPPM